MYLHPDTLKKINFPDRDTQLFAQLYPDGAEINGEVLSALYYGGFDLETLAAYTVAPDIYAEFSYAPLGVGALLAAWQASEYPFWIGQPVHFGYSNAPVSGDKQYKVGSIATITERETGREAAKYLVEWSTPERVGGRIVAIMPEENSDGQED